MNIVLLEPEDVQSDTWSIHSKRQLQHLREHLDITAEPKSWYSQRRPLYH
ncbi:hypothetical protein ACINIS123_1304 [Acinetobacter baumannii IS-123]|nr:hypothetical protein ACINIS123_1304 [Acinetobacter baumannii IS-123]